MKKIMEKLGLIDSGSAYWGRSGVFPCALVIPAVAAFLINHHFICFISLTINALSDYSLIKNNNPEEVGEYYG